MGTRINSDSEFDSTMGQAFCCGFVIAFILFAMAMNQEKKASGAERPAINWTISE